MNRPEPLPPRSQPPSETTAARGTGGPTGTPGPDLQFEIRNVHRGLDIELVVAGRVVEENASEVLRRVATLVRRQPAQLWLDVRPAEIDGAAIELLAGGLIDARAALADEGGKLVVAAAEPGLCRRLPADLVGS